MFGHAVGVLPFAASLVTCAWASAVGVRGSGGQGRRQRIAGAVAVLAGLAVSLLLYGVGDAWLALSFAPFAAWGVLCGVEDYCNLRVPYDSRTVNVLCGLSLVGAACSRGCLAWPGGLLAYFWVVFVSRGWAVPTL